MDVHAAVESVASGLEGIVSVYLFGSVAEGRSHRESDVDFGVLLERRIHPGAKERFEARLVLGTRLTDALGRIADVVILNDAPPLLARAIVTRGQRVLLNDAELDHAFFRDVQLLAADLEPFLRRMRAIKLEAVAPR